MQRGHLSMPIKRLDMFIDIRDIFHLALTYLDGDVAYIELPLPLDENQYQWLNAIQTRYRNGEL